jgi:isoleucyl-tRNA synthetase
VDDNVVYWYSGINVKEGKEHKIFTSEFGDDYDAIPMYEQIYALAGPTQTYRINGDPRIMKDIRYRWRTMQGYYMPFWAGWDCQGLPVELEVEKLLGVKMGKRELLERVGMERFIEECKKAILRYHKMWLEADGKLGVFINQEKAYWTYKDEYIEREWQILKRAWEQNLLEEGHYVVAYCPGCQTSLSSAEVGYEGSYKEVEDPSLYFKFKVTGKENEYFLIWTTMPFTIITDTMLAVQPNAEYVKVMVGGEIWIVNVRSHGDVGATRI